VITIDARSATEDIALAKRKKERRADQLKAKINKVEMPRIPYGAGA
jgi:hypothetical protein